MQPKAAGVNKGNSDVGDVLFDQCNTRVGLKGKYMCIVHICYIMKYVECNKW